jgi:hypothetical protein
MPFLVNHPKIAMLVLTYLVLAPCVLRWSHDAPDFWRNILRAILVSAILSAQEPSILAPVFRHGIRWFTISIMLFAIGQPHVAQPKSEIGFFYHDEL